MTVRPPTRGGRRAATAALLTLAVALACRSARPLAASATRPPIPPVDVSRLEVLMINGGATKSQNYQSHLLHLRGLHDVLRRAGVPEQLIALYVADGADPAVDVARREAQPEPDFWLLEGSRLEGPLRTPVTYENSTVPGAVLAAATRADIQHWFDTTGRTLRTGDTLLLYVTDHGTRNAEDPTNDVFLKAGLIAARALCFRAQRQTETCQADFQSIDKAILEIERRAQNLDEVRKSADTIQSASAKILERVRIDRDALDKQVALLREKLGDVRVALQSP